jgi:Flp pilus assembly protein TadD
LLVPFLAFLLVVAVVYGVWAAGRPAPSAASTASATTASAPVLNEARVAELTAKVQANPKDVTALRGLTDEYYSVGDYGKAAQWQTKVVELQPNDVTSRLVLGAALANSGDSAQAEAQWTKVTQLDPKQAEAWYNLGVLHFSATPSQDDKARAEWAKVVEIDPNSELAKNVTSHLNRVGVATTK